MSSYYFVGLVVFFLRPKSSQAAKGVVVTRSLMVKKVATTHLGKLN